MLLFKLYETKINIKDDKIMFKNVKLFSSYFIFMRCSVHHYTRTIEFYYSYNYNIIYLYSFSYDLSLSLSLFRFFIFWIIIIYILLSYRNKIFCLEILKWNLEVYIYILYLQLSWLRMVCPTSVVAIMSYDVCAVFKI